MSVNADLWVMSRWDCDINVGFYENCRSSACSIYFGCFSVSNVYNNKQSLACFYLLFKEELLTIRLLVTAWQTIVKELIEVKHTGDERVYTPNVAPFNYKSWTKAAAISVSDILPRRLNMAFIMVVFFRMVVPVRCFNNAFPSYGCREDVCLILCECWKRIMW